MITLARIQTTVGFKWVNIDLIETLTYSDALNRTRVGLVSGSDFTVMGTAEEFVEELAKARASAED